MTPSSEMVAPGFEPVAEVFEANIAEGGDTGAAVCVYHGGQKVVDLLGGDYPADALQVLRSATKGVVAIVAHQLWEQGQLDFDAPVIEVWPEFKANGKEHIPIRWLFSHRSGLCAIDRPISMDDVVAWDPVVEALAAQAPLWEPGTTHGYHALTYGWLTGEVLRRLTGRTVGALIADRLAGPLGLDLWVGLPAEQLPRMTSLLAAPPPPPDAPPDPIMAILSDPTSLGARAFLNPMLFGSEHLPEYLAAEFPAANGVSEARSLARLYAATIDNVDGIRVLSGDTVRAASAIQSEGIDAVTLYETRYSTGFQRPFPLRPMAGLGTACFGHYGLGGPLALADPDSGIAFGYTTRQVQNHTGADPRSRLLAEAAVRCGKAAG
jgi:CubicO group peptidase (beta-lactamase class C family)